MLTGTEELTGISQALGLAVGVTVGIAVGMGVGIAVGMGVGIAVGVAVGIAVGVAVGSGVAANPKVAVTVCSADIVTVQVPVPEQPPPLQPLKVLPTAGVAVSITLLFEVKFFAQTVPQSIPVGLLITVPTPLPVLITLKEKGKSNCPARASRTE